MIAIDHKGHAYAYSLNTKTNTKQAVFDDVFYYAIGLDPPHYPVPAILHTVELVHRGFDGAVQFMVMYRKDKPGYLYPVGDYPEYPLVF